jgi:chromosome segregation ATPase
MDGYRDGEMIYRARSLLSTAESSVSSARSRRDDIERKLRGNEDGLLLPGISDTERQRLRNEIDRLRRERRDAEDDIYRYERDADFARRDLDRLRFSLGLRWGAW